MSVLGNARDNGPRSGDFMTSEQVQSSLAADWSPAGHLDSRISHDRAPHRQPESLANRCEISIISPIYNEAENIERHLRGIEEHVQADYEIVLVYDFEEDNTLPVIRGLDPPIARLRLVRNQFGRGVVNAVRTGFAASRGWLGCVVTMADLSDPPRHIPALVQKLRDGFDVVAASRYMPGGKQHGGQLLKRTLARMAGVGAKWITGIGVHDVTTNFRAYSRRLMDDIPIVSRGGFELGLELTTKCHLRGWNVGEIPSDWFDRSAGESKFHFWKLLPGYLKWYLKLLMGDPFGWRIRRHAMGPAPGDYHYFGVHELPGYGWTVWRRKPGVVVLAETTNGETLWIRCRRPYHCESHAGWELPGGAPEQGESVLDAARRELVEETGYTTEDAGTCLVSNLQAMPGMGAYTHVVVLLRNCQKTTSPRSTEAESIEECQSLDVAAVDARIGAGEVQSLPSIGAYYVYRHLVGS